jgi:hypothetical protein
MTRGSMTVEAESNGIARVVSSAVTFLDYVVSFDPDTTITVAHATMAGRIYEGLITNRFWECHGVSLVGLTHSLPVYRG